MVNVPELRKALEFITENPDKHRQAWWLDTPRTAKTEPVKHPDWLEEVDVVVEQDVWTCGTTACFAGWTAILHGWRPTFGADGIVYRKGTGFRHVEEVADYVLDLPDWHNMFSGSSSVRDLWHEAHAMTNGEIEIPEEYK